MGWSFEGGLCVGWGMIFDGSGQSSVVSGEREAWERGRRGALMSYLGLRPLRQMCGFASADEGSLRIVWCPDAVCRMCRNGRYSVQGLVFWTECLTGVGVVRTGKSFAE